MKKIYLFLWLLPVLVRAQAPTTCGCSQNFVEMQRLIKANYAGYRDKVMATTQPKLDSLATALRPQADTAQAGSCWNILQQYLNFFHDGHLSLSDAHPPRLNGDSIRAKYAASERLPWTRASFRAYLDDPSRPKKPLEGIWRDSGSGGYVVGVVAKGQAEYQGFILKADSTFWMPGQVKFTFADPAASPTNATYYMRNHSTEMRKARVVGDGRLDINGPWDRVYPRPVVGLPPSRNTVFRCSTIQRRSTALHRLTAGFGLK